MITDSPKKRAIGGGVPRELIVRLEHCSREPSTPVERLALAILRREGPTPLHVLVKRVASGLFEDELAGGARVLDLGILGSTLFVPDATAGIQAANGVLWQIEQSS
jgi:hypothetical protein